MEAVIFIGLHASGKSTFYKEEFFNSHVRISLDLLKTRYREKLLIEFCLKTQQKFVIDNTNPTRNDRLRYVDQCQRCGFKLIGYYFRSSKDESLARNQVRVNKVPDVAILSTIKKLALPSRDEGFDELKYVRIMQNRFIIEEWSDEI